jgi:hypothetical protein
LFFLESTIKYFSRSTHLQIFGDDSYLEVYKDGGELVDEDQDAKDERKKVYALKKSDFAKYPLIAKDIRKVYPGVFGRPPKVANKNICLMI